MQHDHLVQPLPIPSAPQDYTNAQGWNGMAPYDIPTIDTTFSSHPGSAYGSPQVENQLALSPVAKGISLLDAPLPASFDSQGISVFARQGPIAASVPSRFGYDSSPPSSLPNPRAIDSSTLRNLHSSAFGDDSRSRKYTLGSSPSIAAEDTIGRRIMHSERFSSRPKMLSSSVGARRPVELNDEWEDNFDFTFEEDLVPNSLLEILTPEERRRRLSRTADDENITSHRAALSGLGTPAESSSKVGSPSNASPSRFGALFARQQQQKATENSFNDASGAFGHVGSPLRPSALNLSSSPSLRAVSRPTSGDFSLSSPPRHASHMGMISQQLSRTRISSRGPENAVESANQAQSLQHPGISRVASGGSATTPPTRLDRTASTSSVGVGREKIEEEPELFAMDEVGESKQNAWKRLSSGSGVWGGRGLGVIGSQRGPAGGI
jgi:hypothetical protein